MRVAALLIVALASSASADPAKFAATFAPEVVGTLVPTAPVAGDYAMALTLKRMVFASTELRFDHDVTGAMQLRLAADGTARACLGSRIHHASQGQMHYERDPAKRKHSQSDSAGVVGYSGTWKVVDGVAAIRFDRWSRSSCDTAAVAKSADPVGELTCVAFAATDRVPVRGLACEAPARTSLLELGMPMTPASRTPARLQSRLSGQQLILGAPGIVVKVVQERVPLPVFTFVAGSATVVEADYRAK
ncbi:MAG: hypothetical protein ABI867_15980 [Kofleriaceae bacterium]